MVTLLMLLVLNSTPDGPSNRVYVTMTVPGYAPAEPATIQSPDRCRELLRTRGKAALAAAFPQGGVIERLECRNAI